MAVTLQSRIIYGLKTDISSNVHYITDSEILYPVGNVIAVHNIPQRQQKLIRLPEKHRINIIVVSPNKKLVAICEVGEKPMISIYDLQTLKRRKTLGIPYDAPEVKDFTCIGFSFDSKYLAAVTGLPDQTMLYYNWDKGKVESSLKLAGSPHISSTYVHVLAMNPSDSAVMAVGGRRTFKFLTLSESIWRPYGFSKVDNILACSMAWLNSDRLLLGTEDGKIMYLENGDLKNIYKMSETLTMDLKIREEYVIQASSSLTNVDSKIEIPWENNIRSLMTFQRGFVYAYGNRFITLFERESRNKYTKRNVYMIPDQLTHGENLNLYQVNTLNVNPSFDHLIVTTTGWPQILCATLWGPDLNEDPEPQKLRNIDQSLHYGPIGGLSMSVWKPIFLTFGQIDFSVRLWNFETESLILLKQYTEEICSVAMHPTGLFCLIGFVDKLRFMAIMIDDLLPMEEFAIRSCKNIAFSHGGHLFAAVHGFIVQVYSSIGFYNRFILKGHTSRVKTLLWSQTDKKLLTLGGEGAIYQWDMSTGKRVGEIILRTYEIYDIALTLDETSPHFIANDSVIREIKDHAVFREYNLPEKYMYLMVLGKEDQVLFLVCPGGVILSVNCPLLEPLEYAEFHIHSADITQIALSHNEQNLVSVAMDGSLCMWKLFYHEGKGTVSKELPYTNEVLISKDDLEDKIKTIEHQTVRMRELETEHAYKMRQIDVMHNDKVQELHEGYCEAIEELKDRIEKIQEEHKTELNTINVDIVRMKAAHEQTMNELEISYDGKLIMEFDKYQALEELNNETRRNYEKRLKDLDEEKSDELKRTKIEYEALLHEKKLELEEAQDEMAHNTRVHEQLTKQIEDDADQEILDMRTDYEGQLYNEQQQILRLKGESGMMRNRYMASQKDVQDLKRQVQRVQSEYEYFQKTIRELEKDIEDLKKEINERDTTIQDREREIYEMKRSNQELEKFKFVLNYKITELKNQIEPRDQEIKELNEKIRDMETELVNLHKTNVSLELQLHELREKLRAARLEIQSEVHYNKRCEQLLKRIRVDLLDASGLVQEPLALKAAVTKLYHKYSSSDDFLRTRKADLDAQCEFVKQRDHLERTIASLQKQVFQDASVERKGLDKTAEENIILIAELNSLREELKVAQKHILHVEGLLGLRATDIRSMEARNKLEKACYGHEELWNKYRSEMQECQNIIVALQDDIHRLINKLSTVEPREETN